MACTRSDAQTGGVPLNSASKKTAFKKYSPFQQIQFDDKWKVREWPSKTIKRAPRWCTVDLRDGNQALENPMNVNQKLRMYQHLVNMGFKEIEIGFPSSSQIEFDFCRCLVDEQRIPDDVWISVLVQAREPLIRRTIEAVKGAKNILIHMYNSTSTLQREVVFRKNEAEIEAMAVQGVSLIRQLVDSELLNTKDKPRVRLEYSPESFTGTELPFALRVCESVRAAWRTATPSLPIIFNLPATVEMSTPNIYADQIEWFNNHLTDRETAVISLHAHNDRGCAVAATELALMAGADRVEGCLFGNGERTGNVCLVTLAVNLLSQGVDPELDVSDMPSTIAMFEQTTGMSVGQRHPWAGQLVYSAFSGSHQDAIKKGLSIFKEKTRSGVTADWRVPYLPIDPTDVGMKVDLIRINSQSGKGGVAYIMATEFGIDLPAPLQIEFGSIVKQVADKAEKEIDAAQLKTIFEESYFFSNPKQSTPISLLHFSVSVGSPRRDSGSFVKLTAGLKAFGEEVLIENEGNGPINAFIHGLSAYLNRTGRVPPLVTEDLAGAPLRLSVGHYSTLSAGHGSSAAALCFAQVIVAASSLDASPSVMAGVPTPSDAVRRFGVAKDEDTSKASLLAIVSGVNHLFNADPKVSP
eukprot:Selendium_serpulae@DN5257_c0_g1_i1.p1